MTNQQYEQYKKLDIDFVMQHYKENGSIVMQMNVVTERNGNLNFMPIALPEVDRQRFYNAIAPAMLQMAEQSGTIVYLSIICEAWLREPDIIDGKPDMKTYRDKPARDIVFISFQTKDKTELISFEVIGGILVRKPELEDIEVIGGDMATILKDHYLKRQRKQN